MFRGISERENGVIRETFAQAQMSQTARPRIKARTPLMTQRSSISTFNNNNHHQNTELQGFRIFRKRASTGTIYPAEKQIPEQPQSLPIGLVAARCMSYNKLKYPIKAVHKSDLIASRIAKVTACNVRQLVTYKGVKFG